MAGGDDNRRVLAACDRCGSVYASIKTGDGEIRPIGNRTGCTCGSTEFTQMRQATESDDAEESPEAG